MTYQLLVFELVQRETVTFLLVVVIVLYVGDNALTHLQLHVLGRGVLGAVFVFCLKVLSDYRTMGDDIGTEIIRQHGNKHTGEHIGTQQTLEGYTSRQHRYNLRIACQFRCKEYYGDEDKQRAEQIREIRNEVDIIVKDNGFERSMETAEYLFVKRS